MEEVEYEHEEWNITRSCIYSFGGWGGEGRMDGNWIIQTGVKILQPVASESEVVTSSS